MFGTLNTEILMHMQVVGLVIDGILVGTGLLLILVPKVSIE